MADGKLLHVCISAKKGIAKHEIPSFADPSQFQQNRANPQLRAHAQLVHIESVDYKIFPERTGLQLQPFGAHELNVNMRQ